MTFKDSYNTKNVLVDFDKTICPNADINNPPSPHCIILLNKLKSSGHTITIYSVRSNKNESTKHNVPYDDIHFHKPHVRYIIDDRCAGIKKDSDGNVDWEHLNTILS